MPPISARIGVMWATVIGHLGCLLVLRLAPPANRSAAMMPEPYDGRSGMPAGDCTGIP